ILPTNAPFSITAGNLNLEVPPNAVKRAATLVIELGITPPPLSPDHHLRHAFRISVIDSAPPPSLPTGTPAPLFHFEAAGTLTISYAGLEDPNLPDTTLQVRLLAPRKNLWVEVPAEFDYQAKTVTVTIWHEGIY